MSNAAVRAERSSPPDLHTRLSDHRRYLRQIDRLHKKYLFTRHLYLIEQDKVSLASVVMNQSRVAKLIARTVKRGAYRIQPGQVRTIRVNGKERVVYAYRITDLIVHGVVAEIVRESMDSVLSQSLYSYRKGIPYWRPVSRFAAYVRAHRKSRTKPETRGIYVLRQDIDSYTDSIPVGEQSPVWQTLKDLLDPSGGGRQIARADWDLIVTVVRPEIYTTEGMSSSLWRGVPTGQPISCVLFNLYLANFDHQLDQIPGSFYARYSDDILFAHPDPEIVRMVDSRIDSLLAGLRLKVNHAKSQNFYLNGAGRRSSAWPDAKGTTSVPFLGFFVAATGTISLTQKKFRGFLRDIEQRAARTARAIRGADIETIGRVVCSVVNRATHPRSDSLESSSAILLHRAVTDRRQLKQLDYWIARIVLRVATGDDSIKQFRNVSYRKIRKVWGLRSILHARNTA